MKRRDFLTQAGAAAAVGVTSTNALGQAQGMRWRMSTMWPKSLDTMYGSAELFAKRVGEITEGRFTIQSTAAGEIVPPPQVFDAVQNGTIECGHVLSSFFFGKNPAIRLRRRHALRPQRSPADGLDVSTAAALQALREVFAKFNIVQFPVRQRRRADGRLVPQGDQYGRGSQGTQVPHRRHRRHDPVEARRRAAADPDRRDLHRRSRRASSTPPSGSAPTTTRSSA